MTQKQVTGMYYFINDFNDICRQADGTDKDFAEIIDVIDLVEDANNLVEENNQLKQELFETSKELLWATSDEVDRVLHFEDEVEDLRKEIFE